MGGKIKGAMTMIPGELYRFRIPIFGQVQIVDCKKFGITASPSIRRGQYQYTKYFHICAFGYEVRSWKTDYRGSNMDWSVVRKRKE